jgi:hypothetical protein
MEKRLLAFIKAHQVLSITLAALAGLLILGALPIWNRHPGFGGGDWHGHAIWYGAHDH